MQHDWLDFNPCSVTGCTHDLKQPPPLLRFTSVNEEKIGPWFLGCLLVLNRVIHACEMLGEAVSLSFFFKAWIWQIPIAVCTTWPWDAISGTWGQALQMVFVCLDFLRKGLKKNWPVVSACKPPPRHPSSTAVGKKARPFQMRHLMVILLPLAKHKTPPPLPPVSFCATANIAMVLAGRGSYFVYVWTSILIDRISCNPILNYRFFKQIDVTNC